MNEIDQEFAELEAEWEKEQQYEREYYAQVHAQNVEFEKKWPHYCRACGGWGGSDYPATGPSYSCGGEPGGFGSVRRVTGRNVSSVQSDVIHGRRGD